METEKGASEWGIKGNTVISAMFYLSSKKWLPDSFSSSSFDLTDISQRRDEFTGIHSCFYSAGARVVVILPSFTIALFKGNPFLYPTHQPPPPISHHFFLHIQREQSSPAAKWRAGTGVYGESRKLWKMIGHVLNRKIHFAGKLNIHTLITKIKCDASLGWEEVQ